MQIPLLTEEECAILAKLAEGRPSRSISPPTLGRLALYNLIDETPEGWAITAVGKRALSLRPTGQPANARPSALELGPRDGRRRRRVSPFP
jgi:hypothetical protein